MVRKMIRLCLSSAFGLMAIMACYGVATSADDKVPDISTIMRKSFKDKDSFMKSVGSAVKGDKWEDAQKLAKEWNELGTNLGKNKPPMGDDKSWEDHTKKFAENTKAIYDGADKKDASAVNKALKSFNCMGCHTAHRSK